MEGWVRKVMGKMAWLWDRLGFGTSPDWFGAHMDQVYSAATHLVHVSGLRARLYYLQVKPSGVWTSLFQVFVVESCCMPHEMVTARQPWLG